ncbi:MAG: Tryptophan synthase alpha chain [Myxococcales bacterium]|nr:Tryptophan synthase alpha chain [Myxococcales bacterium]
MKTAATRALLVALTLTAAACDVNSYCLNCADAGRVVSGGGTDDLGEVDLAPAGPDLETCNPMTVDTDPFNCGGCGIVCPHAHAIPACIGGACKVKSCDVGWIDLDGNPANDCEYGCLPTGAEVCDGKDNDCNGQIDEGIDKSNDPLNCGVCGTACSFANGVATCVNGVCTLGSCDTGYADLDPTKPGCEYRCPVYPPQPTEQCNGLDDNCDGQVDEAAHLEAAPTTLCVTRANTPCAGTVASCVKRGGVTTWYCGYGAGVEFDPSLPNGIATVESRCDGKDGNCDGQTDESFASVGGGCDNGLRGACRDVGAVKCDPADDTKTLCDLSVLPDAVPGAPTVEQCNNVDDDCDGVVDNTTGPMRLVRDMVHITTGGRNYYIDRYEGSRSDATSAAAGVVDVRSCSNANVQPWTRLAYASAQAACAASGVRLCSADEWQTACEGSPATAYPYGASYVGATCNGVDFAATHALVATGAPSVSQCVSVAGVHDLSGNAKEWTSDQQGSTSGMPSQPIYVVRGGAYASPSAGLTCGTTFSRASADTALDDLGFRCCSSTAP